MEEVERNIILFPYCNTLPNIAEGQKLRYIKSQIRSDGGYNHIFNKLDD